MISSFSVENYRAFSRPQTIELRPLTLLFGWNSGGKSALLRFLPLLSESIAAHGPPIWLGGNVGRGASWSDLVCKASESTRLRFSVEWDQSLGLRATWDVAGDIQGKWQEVRDLKVQLDEAVFSCGSKETEKDWIGLYPRDSEGAASGPVLGALVPLLRRLCDEVQWLSGIRTKPLRVFSYGGGAMSHLSFNGGDAMDQLIAAHLQSPDHPLLAALQTFFGALGERLALDELSDGVWRLLLQPLGSPKVGVNICDTGEGYSQVLPILVALARACSNGPRIVCLEQPELHLHTRAQSELAKTLVRTAMAETKPKLLVETHSEVLLTSVQLAIANGEIPAEMVRVYWVESRNDGTSDVVPVDFTAEGKPTTTALVGAFREAADLGQELIGKQLAKLRP